MHILLCMARPRIRHGDVVDTAIDLVDRESLDSLSLAAVANVLGVRSSALYTYVDGLDALRFAVAVQAMINLTETVRDAALGHAGDNALSAVAYSYRGFAFDHPGQYASTLLPPHRPNDELVLATADLLKVFSRIISAGWGYQGDDAVYAARTARSAIHGFVALEAGQAFTSPADGNASFKHLVHTVIVGLS